MAVTPDALAAITGQEHTEGRRHSGLVFTSDASMPRSRDSIGRHVDVLHDLLDTNPAEEAFADRVHRLGDRSPGRPSGRRSRRAGQ